MKLSACKWRTSTYSITTLKISIKEHFSWLVNNFIVLQFINNIESGKVNLNHCVQSRRNFVQV